MIPKYKLKIILEVFSLLISKICPSFPARCQYIINFLIDTIPIFLEINPIIA